MLHLNVRFWLLCYVLAVALLVLLLNILFFVASVRSQTL